VDHDNPAEMTGETIAGRYRLLEPLGSGAMSAVWLARDDELERQVAVKLLAASADRARFEREARAVAALSHPNICALYDYGEADGKPYMVLEYLPNGSLEERLHTGQPLADDETLRIATDIAAGLAHAHERGLVHRDLKPANVLFDAEGRAKIADFGIASMGDAATLTEAGTVLGTAAYISPEQAGGLPAGPASDVYSVGVILFRMLTGAFPFVSTNVMELVRMHRDDPPRPVADARPDAPPRLASIVTASLAKDPTDRPTDGAALERELRGGGEAAAVTDATQVLRPRPAARRRRPPLVPLAAIAAVLLVAGGALATLLTDGGSSNGTSTTSGLSLPRVPAVGSTNATTTLAPATVATTTAATTTATQPVTTAPVTTALPPATTAPALPTTTAALPTTPAAPPTTTAPATTDTAPVTTDQGTTTTATP